MVLLSSIGSAVDASDSDEPIDILRLNVLGRAEAVDGLPVCSVLLVSESNAAVLAFGDISELMLAISRSLLCWSLFGL